MYGLSCCQKSLARQGYSQQGCSPLNHVHVHQLSVKDSLQLAQWHHHLAFTHLHNWLPHLPVGPRGGVGGGVLGEGRGVGVFGEGLGGGVVGCLGRDQPSWQQHM